MSTRVAGFDDVMTARQGNPEIGHFGPFLRGASESPQQSPPPQQQQQSTAFG
jgi:hypothetical protein